MYSSTHAIDASPETIILLHCVAEDLLCWCFLNDLSFRMKDILLGLGSAYVIYMFDETSKRVHMISRVNF